MFNFSAFFLPSGSICRRDDTTITTTETIALVSTRIADRRGEAPLFLPDARAQPVETRSSVSQFEPRASAAQGQGIRRRFASSNAPMGRHTPAIVQKGLLRRTRDRAIAIGSKNAQETRKKRVNAKLGAPNCP